MRDEAVLYEVTQLLTNARDYVKKAVYEIDYNLDRDLEAEASQIYDVAYILNHLVKYFEMLQSKSDN